MKKSKQDTKLTESHVPLKESSAHISKIKNSNICEK